MKMQAFPLLFGIALTSTVLLSGCLPNRIPPPPDSEASLDFTTLEGTISITGETVVLQSVGKSTVLDSYSVDFSPYVGSQVRVAGKYSGDTLFVKEIETKP